MGKLRFASLKIKFLLGYLAVFFVVLGLFLVFIFGFVRETLVKNEADVFSIELAGVSERFSTILDSVAGDLFIFKDLPPLQRVLENGPGLEYETSLNDFEGVLLAAEDIRDYYNQIRYIDENGMEVVRVDHRAVKPVVVEDSELQDKSSRNYFVETMKLDEGELYLSEVELNIEFGEVEQPYFPVFRYSTPVFNDDGDRKGILIINVAFEQLIRNIFNDNDTEGLVVFDSDGYYLFNQDRKKLWGRDLSHGQSAISDYNLKIFESFVNGSRSGVVNLEDSYLVFSKVVPTGESENFFVVLKELESARILAGVDSQVFWFVLTGVAFMVVLSGFYLIYVSKKLGSLSLLLHGIQEMKNGNYNHRIDLDSKDDFQALANGFNLMSEEIEHMHDSNTEKIRRLKLAVDATVNFIYITDIDGIVIYANPAVEKLTGYTVEETVGKKAGVLWGRQMSTQYYKDLWNTIKKKKEIFKSEIKGINRSGAVFYAEISISPVLNSDGEIMYFVAVQNDITEKTISNEIRTQFIGIASHQLRTPMTAVRWNTQMLLSTDLGELNSQQSEVLQDLLDSEGRMIDLINNLLEVSKIDEKHVEVNVEKFDVRELVQEVYKDVNEVALRRNVEVSFDYGNDLPMIEADKVLFSQVVKNLILNAVFYSPKESGKVKVSLVVEESGVLLEVRDNGIGIPEEDSDKIFTKFFRASNAVKSFTDGSGIGLYLCKAIMELLGGEIDFKSKEGKGTAFYVRIPLTKSEDEE